jgi:hypothetical protein
MHAQAELSPRGKGHCPPKQAKTGSGDNIRRETIRNHGQLIAQIKFALLQALHLELINRSQMLQSSNCRIQIAMFNLETMQLILIGLAFFFAHLSPHASLKHHLDNRSKAARPAHFDTGLGVVDALEPIFNHLLHKRALMQKIKANFACEAPPI